MNNKPEKEATVGIALIPICFLIVMLVFSLRFEGLDPHIPIFMSAMLAAVIGIFGLGYQWKHIQKEVIHTVSLSMEAILILMIIGMVIGTWILSGVVPSMIHLGLQLFSEQIRCNC